MPDKLNRIDAWKRDVLRGDAITPTQADELEDHLRDEMNRLGAAGLSDAETFVIARMRIGSADEVEAEYAKCNPMRVWQRRMTWMIFGYLALSLSQFASIFAFVKANHFRVYSNLPWGFISTCVILFVVSTAWAIALMLRSGVTAPHRRVSHMALLCLLAFISQTLLAVVGPVLAFGIRYNPEVAQQLLGAGVVYEWVEWASWRVGFFCPLLLWTVFGVAVWRGTMRPNAAIP